MGMIISTIQKSVRIEETHAELLAVQVPQWMLVRDSYRLPWILLTSTTELSLPRVSPLIPFPVSAPVQALHLAYPFPVWRSSGSLSFSSSFIPDAELALL